MDTSLKSLKEAFSNAYYADYAQGFGLYAFILVTPADNRAFEDLVGAMDELHWVTGERILIVGPSIMVKNHTVHRSNVSQELEREFKNEHIEEFRKRQSEESYAFADFINCPASALPAVVFFDSIKQPRAYVVWSLKRVSQLVISFRALASNLDDGCQWRSIAALRERMDKESPEIRILKGKIKGQNESIKSRSEKASGTDDPILKARLEEGIRQRKIRISTLEARIKTEREKASGSNEELRRLVERAKSPLDVLELWGGASMTRYTVDANDTVWTATIARAKSDSAAFAFAGRLTSCEEHGSAEIRVKWSEVSDQQNNFWYEFNHSDTVLIFVHGIFSDSKSCWYHDGGKQGPRSIFWPDLILGDERLELPSVFLGGFATSFDSGSSEVRDCAKQLYSSMNRNIESGQGTVMERRNIVFICHSTGGMVARYILTEHWEVFASKKVGLVLIASPSYGAGLATLLRWVAKLYKNRLAQQLQSGHWSLSDLDARFKNLLHEKRIPDLAGVEAYENHFIFHRKFLPPLKIVVSRDSAGRYFADPTLLPNTDHFTSVKPDGPNHPAHVLLVDFWKHQFKPMLEDI